MMDGNDPHVVLLRDDAAHDHLPGNDIYQQRLYLKKNATQVIPNMWLT